MHKLQTTNTLYYHATSAYSAHIEKIIANSERKYCERNTTPGNMWEDYNVDDVLYVLGNLQKRDTGARISPVQFLHDRELGIRGEKHGIVIREPVSD